MRAPSVALMMPPPMRATSIWSAVLVVLLARLDTSRFYACDGVHKVCRASRACVTVSRDEGPDVAGPACPRWTSCLVRATGAYATSPLRPPRGRSAAAPGRRPRSTPRTRRSRRRARTRSTRRAPGRAPRAPARAPRPTPRGTRRATRAGRSGGPRAPSRATARTAREVRGGRLGTEPHDRAAHPDLTPALAPQERQRGVRVLREGRALGRVRPRGERPSVRSDVLEDQRPRVDAPARVGGREGRGVRGGQPGVDRVLEPRDEEVDGVVGRGVRVEPGQVGAEHGQRAQPLAQPGTGLLGHADPPLARRPCGRARSCGPGTRQPHGRREVGTWSYRGRVTVPQR